MRLKFLNMFYVMLQLDFHFRIWAIAREDGSL